MISYAIAPHARLVTCEVTEDLRLLDVANLIEELFGETGFSAEFNTLVLIADATILPDLTARNALVQLMSHWRTMQVKSKWAFVVHGSGWQRLADHVIEQHGLDRARVQCFADTVTALAWVNR